MPVQLHADHIAGEAGGFEPQRVNHWSVRFTGVTDANILQLSLQDFTPPKEVISSIAVPYGNREVKVAGRVTVDQASISFKDFVNANTWQVLYAWFLQTHNPFTGTIGFASEYKKRATLIYAGPDGTHERQWSMRGCWLSRCDASQLDQSGDSVHLLSATLEVDRMIPINLVANQ